MTFDTRMEPRRCVLFIHTNRKRPIQCIQSHPFFDRNTTYYLSGILPTVDAHSMERRSPVCHRRLPARVGMCSTIQSRDRTCLFEATLSNRAAVVAALTPGLEWRS